MDEQPVEVFAVPGRVKWYDARKGYGFVQPVGAGGAAVEIADADIMLHVSVIRGPGYRWLRDGQAVRFDAVRTSRGWKVTRVEKVAGDWPDDPGTSGVGAVPKRPPGLL
ncbi:MAG: cold-shock protein [Phycisphaerales bacterium JB060]